MQVIAFNGSPHRNGTVHKGLITITEVLEQEGIETEIVQVGNQNIRGCMGCQECRTLKHCVYQDDMVNHCFDKVNAADGVILGSPVYYGGIAGTFKSFLDRLFYPGLNLKCKPATTVVSLRRSGGISAFHQLNNYLNLAQAIITPSVYWNMIHGNNAEEVLQDGEGLHIMRTVGKNMAWLLKIIATGKEIIPLPSPEKRVWTNFIH